MEKNWQFLPNCQTLFAKHFAIIISILRISSNQYFYIFTKLLAYMVLYL